MRRNVVAVLRCVVALTLMVGVCRADPCPPLTPSGIKDRLISFGELAKEPQTKGPIYVRHSDGRCIEASAFNFSAGGLIVQLSTRSQRGIVTPKQFEIVSADIVAIKYRKRNSRSGRRLGAVIGVAAGVAIGATVALKAESGLVALPFIVGCGLVGAVIGGRSFADYQVDRIIP